MNIKKLLIIFALLLQTYQSHSILVKNYTKYEIKVATDFNGYFREFYVTSILPGNSLNIDKIYSEEDAFFGTTIYAIITPKKYAQSFLLGFDNYADITFIEHKNKVAVIDSQTPPKWANSIIKHYEQKQPKKSNVSEKNFEEQHEPKVNENKTLKLLGVAAGIITIGYFIYHLSNKDDKNKNLKS